MVNIIKQTDLSREVTDVPVASHAFTLYKANGQVCSATRHRITDGRLGCGQVISLKRLREQLLATGNNEPVALLPESVFISSHTTLAWVTRAQRRTMWFNLAGRKRGYSVYWPHLIWIADRTRRRLHLFCSGRAKRPDYDTVLYHAPLMNIDNHGLLCEGSASLPRKLSVASISKMESCLFDACFTHTNHENTLKGGASNARHLAYWRDQEKQRAKVRVSSLVRFGTLREALQCLEN